MDLGNWFARRSEDQYAHPVERIEDLRPEVQAVLLPTLEPGELVRYMIDAPYQGRLKRRDERRTRSLLRLPWQLTPDWLLALTPRRLLLASTRKDGSLPEVLSIPLENILRLQSGVILLLSWFEITWVEQGLVRSQEIYFNAVCERFFDRLSLLVRSEMTPQPAALRPANLSNREILEPLPYKFRNLIPMRLLLPGEQIARIVFRPATYARVAWLFRRMTAPKLVLALTDRHLILAEEELGESENSYGLIATFIARSQICDAHLSQQEKQVALHLRTELHGAEREMTIPFPVEAAPDLRALLEELQGNF